MKADCRNALAGFATMLAVAFITVTPSPAAVSRPDPSSTLELAATGDTASLTLTNFANQVWVIQSSSNLRDWTETESWKIFNGNFHRSLTHAGNPNVFYRAFFDPARQNINSTTINALLLPAVPFHYANPALPASFLVNPILGQDNTPANNPVSDPGATLGRVLFYDKRLSTNQTVACASCHQQAHGFADPRRFSVGFDDRTGARNAMGLSNARWYQRRHFFWDERAATLEDQVLLPIQNPIEMGMTLDALTTRLAAEPY